ncbi:hypothetical protein A3Q56_06140 [Intoshia linei]|uniref:DUF3668 domain-containing protein n=1 Tax=Intoshia linei TaxID=1819745 RepID=A0A177AVT4_9BILA|nr:hypothetical protein A3Q56_06140 [Intoshia linei]
MKEKYANCLLIVSIREVKNLQIKPGNDLQIECRLNKEILTTDAINPSNETKTVLVEQELAWELKFKDLQRFRIYRSSIRCNFFVANKKNGAKDCIGYVVLEVKNAHKKNEPTWMTLLNSKSNRGKPQCLISLYVEDEIREYKETDTELSLNLNQKEGCFVIEPKFPNVYKNSNLKPSKNKKQFFSFTITVENVLFLYNLIPTNTQIAPLLNGYTLRFTIFDKNVSTLPIFNLFSNNFVPEISKFRLKCRSSDLRQYLINQDVFFTFAGSDIVMGIGKLQFADIIDVYALENIQQSLLIETKLIPPKDNVPHYDKIHNDERAQLKLKINIELQNLENSLEQVPIKTTHKILNQSDDDENQKNVKQSNIEIIEPTIMNSQSLLQNDIVDLAITIHFKNITCSNTYNQVYIKFKDDVIGLNNCVITHPRIDLIPNVLVDFSNSICESSFSIKSNKYPIFFNSHIFNGEMFSLKDGNDDCCHKIGNLQFRLGDFGKNLLGSYQKNTPVISDDETQVATVFIEIEIKKVECDPKLKEIKSGVDEAKNVEKMHILKSNQTVDKKLDRNTTDAIEYKVAFELELWKNEQMKEFKLSYKKKEETLLSKLENEFSDRENQRAILYEKKIKEYTSLEDKLRETLSDLKLVDSNIKQRDKEVISEYEQKYLELDIYKKKIEAQCEHKIRVERLKTSELEELTCKLRYKVEQSESKYTHLETEYNEFRQHLRTDPQHNLKFNVAKLSDEIDCLKNKVACLRKSKKTYKDKYSEAIKEILKYKENENKTQKIKIVKQAMQIEEFRGKIDKANCDKEKYSVQEINKLNQIADLKHDIEFIKNKTVEKEEIENRNNREMKSKLIQERTSLMNTKNYTEKDTLIKQLDDTIKLMSK